MRKILKKALSVVLATAMVLTTGGVGTMVNDTSAKAASEAQFTAELWSYGTFAGWVATASGTVEVNGNGEYKITAEATEALDDLFASDNATLVDLGNYEELTAAGLNQKNGYEVVGKSIQINDGEEIAWPATVVEWDNAARMTVHNGWDPTMDAVTGVTQPIQPGDKITVTFVVQDYVTAAVSFTAGLWSFGTFAGWAGVASGTVEVNGYGDYSITAEATEALDDLFASDNATAVDLGSYEELTAAGLNQENGYKVFGKSIQINGGEEIAWPAAVVEWDSSARLTVHNAWNPEMDPVTGVTQPIQPGDTITVSFTVQSYNEESEPPIESTPPSVELVEVFTANQVSTIIPETVSDGNYNIAKITLECAGNTSFHEWAVLKVVVTVNGTATTYSQVGIGGWGTGWKGSFDIRLSKTTIKKGDTYKIEAYTEAFSDITDSYIYAVGATLEYSDEEYPRPGMLYDGQETVIMSNSRALKDFDSMTVNIQCASDVSYNPWMTIKFVVTVNGVSKEINVTGNDENYQPGTLKSCILEGLNIQEGDLVNVTAITYDSSAVDYIFILTIQDVDELVEPSMDSMLPSITGPTVSSSPSTTAEPSEEPSEAPTEEPSAAPTTAPSDEPSIEPSTAPSTEPSTTPTKEPDIKKGDKVTSSGLEYKVTSTTSKTVTYTDVKNNKKSSVTIPKTVKTTVNGKSTTYKVTAIAKNAFKGNKNVNKVTIGTNVQTIGEGAFKNCSNLKTIIIKSTNITKVGKNAFKGISNKLVVKVPKKKVAAYQKLFKGKGNNNLVVKAI